MRLRLLFLGLALVGSSVAYAETTYTLTFTRGTSTHRTTVPLEGFAILIAPETAEGPGETKPVTLEFRPTSTLAFLKTDARMDSLVVNKRQSFSGRPTVISHFRFSDIRIVEVTTRKSERHTLNVVKFMYGTLRQTDDQ